MIYSPLRVPLSGYFETGKSKEEIEKVKKHSNKYVDTRREKDKERYDIKQKLNIYEARKRNIEIDLNRFKGLKITKDNIRLIETLKIRLKNVKDNITALKKKLKEL